jgi:hypothetical protein
LLRELIRQGIIITQCSAFVAELLHAENRDSWASAVQDRNKSYFLETRGVSTCARSGR